MQQRWRVTRRKSRGQAPGTAGKGRGRLTGVKLLARLLFEARVTLLAMVGARSISGRVYGAASGRGSRG